MSILLVLDADYHLFHSRTPKPQRDDCIKAMKSHQSHCHLPKLEQIMEINCCTITFSYPKMCNVYFSVSHKRIIIFPLHYNVFPFAFCIPCITFYNSTLLLDPLFSPFLNEKNRTTFGSSLYSCVRKGFLDLHKKQPFQIVA